MKLSETNTPIEYPNIANWMKNGSIEFSTEFGSKVIARALDKGGIIWESSKHANIIEAMQALDARLALEV